VNDGDTNTNTDFTLDFALGDGVSLGDLVFADTNGNGVYDSSTEVGQTGITVQLLEATTSNVLLTTACATVLVGTLYPLVLETFTGSTISVGAPYFNMTFAPLMVPLLIAMPFGPALAWKRGDLAAAAQRLWFAAVLTLAATLAVLAFYHRGPWLAPVGLAVGVWVILGALVDAGQRIQIGRASASEVLQRLRSLPRAVHGTTIAHVGVGIMVIGIVATSAYQSERILILKPKESTDIAGYKVTFDGTGLETGSNYTAETGIFSVTRPGWSSSLQLLPSQRRYDKPRQTTSEAGIHVSWRGDLYVVLGDAQGSGGRTIRIYFNPLVRLIWGGALIMVIGGLMSLSDRRLRVGAPRRARGRMVAAPAE
jgi:cytochrome c-type biogenesis protein CcmF